MATPAEDTETGDLEIYINRQQPTAVEAPAVFSARENFTITLFNEGEAVHVHLSCDDDLATALDLETGNHYVHRDGAYHIPADIRDVEPPVRGKLKISVGYGAEASYVEVRILERPTRRTVEVDESLAEPPQREPEPGVADIIVTHPVRVLLLGLAILLSITVVIAVGVLVDPIVAGVLAALFLVFLIGLVVLGDRDG